MSRRTRLLGAVALSVALLLGLGLVFLFQSEAGLRWAFALAARGVPGELSADRVEGRLGGPVAIRGLRLRTPGLDVDVDVLTVDWQPWRLADAEVRITKLAAEGVRILAPAQPDTEAQGERPLPQFDLPLDIALVQARIDGLAFQQGEGAETRRLHRARLEAYWRGGTLKVQEFAAEAAEGTVRLSGTLRPRGRYPLDLHLDWERGRTAGPGWSGEGTIAGDLGDLSVQHALSGPLRMALEARLQGLERPETLRLTGRLRLAESEFGAGEAGFAVERATDVWHLRRLSAVLPAIGARLDASGEVRLDTAPQARLQATWSDLAWPLAGEPRLLSPAGKVRLDGWVDDYALALEARLTEAAGRPLGHWQLTASGNRGGLTADAVQAQLWEGELGGRAAATWDDGLTWDLRLDAKALNPGLFAADWPGRVDLALAHAGTLRQGALSTRTRVERLAGQLRGYPVQARLSASTEGKALRLEALHIAQGDNRLTGAGEVAANWNLSWTVDAPALQAVHPEAGGTLHGKGRVTGPRALPRLAVHLEGEGLRLGEANLARIAADVDLDLQRERPSGAVLDLAGAQFAGQTLDTVRLEGKGRLGQHRLEASARRADTRLRLVAEGGWIESAWRGQLSRTELTGPGFGRWQLAAPAPLRIGASAAALEQTCLTAAAGGRACLEAQWQRPAGLHARGTADGLPLGLFEPLAPAGLQLPGHVHGSLDLKYGAAARALTAEVRLPASELRFAVEGEPPQVVAYADTRLAITSEGSGVRATLKAPFPELGRIEGQLDLPSFWAPDHALARQPVNGRLTADLGQLDMLGRVLPNLYAVQGRTRIDARLGGTLGAPRLAGQLALRDGAARLPQLGIQLEQVQLTVRDSPEGELELTGEARSGGGRLRLEGRIGLDLLQGGAARLSISGDAFQVARLPEATVFASPRLELVAARRTLRLTGTVTVPRASISAGEFQPAVSPSGDVVIVDGREPPEQARESAWRLAARVRLVLGEAVHVKGFGLSARVTGNVTAVDEAGKPTLAEGELRVAEGEYKIYGRELQITEGRLLFAGGPVTNPGVEARAVRKVQEITAGVRVSGELRSPRVELFSEPAMDDSDVLSYIVLGRPLNAAGQGEGEALYQAARSLGLAGGGLLAKRLQSTFGLDVFSIETTETGTGAASEEPALVLGKYLSPRLYVTYAIGLFEDNDVLQFRYEIDRHWRLQTETGTTSGWDLIYSIER